MGAAVPVHPAGRMWVGPVAGVTGAVCPDSPREFTAMTECAFCGGMTEGIFPMLFKVTPGGSFTTSMKERIGRVTARTVLPVNKALAALSMASLTCLSTSLPSLLDPLSMSSLKRKPLVSCGMGVVFVTGEAVSLVQETAEILSVTSLAKVVSIFTGNRFVPFAPIFLVGIDEVTAVTGDFRGAAREIIAMTSGCASGLSILKDLVTMSVGTGPGIRVGI